MILALLVQFASPVASHSMSSPKILNDFITENDLPKDWIKHDKWDGGAAYFTYLRVFVSLSGQPVGCEVATTFGLPKLFDPCALVLARAKFRAATDQAGKPIFGVTYVWFFWQQKKWMGAKYDYIFPPDLSLAVNALPRPAPFGTYVKVDVLSDRNGHVEACSPMAGVDAATLGRLACTEIAGADVVAAKDASKTSVRAVQSLVVTFHQQNSRTNDSH